MLHEHEGYAAVRCFHLAVHLPLRFSHHVNDMLQLSNNTLEALQLHQKKALYFLLETLTK